MIDQLELWGWEKRIAEIDREKSHVAKEISRAEKSITDIDKEKTLAEQSYRLTLKQLNEKVQSLRDIQQYIPSSNDSNGNGNIETAETKKANDAKIEALKKDKKVLVK